MRGAAKQRAVNTSLLMVTRFVIVDILRNYMEKAKHVLYLTIFVFFNLVNYGLTRSTFLLTDSYSTQNL